MLFGCSFAVVAGLDGVEGQSELHASHGRRATECVQGATVVQVPDARGGHEPHETCDHAVGRLLGGPC